MPNAFHLSLIENQKYYSGDTVPIPNTGHVEPYISPSVATEGVPLEYIKVYIGQAPVKLRALAGNQEITTPPSPPRAQQ